MTFAKEIRIDTGARPSHSFGNVSPNHNVLASKHKHWHCQGHCTVKVTNHHSRIAT